MESTIINKIEQLDSKERRAIELKYLGTDYRKISEEIGVEYSTIRSWFMTGGRLLSLYISYAKQENDEASLNARILFRATTEKAVRTLIGLLDSSSEKIRLMAAKEIIDRDFGENALQEMQDEIKMTDILAAAKRLYDERHS